MKLVLLSFFVLYSTGILAQVGINTENPKQRLHIAGATGTLRVEGLNSVNNGFNGGDANGDMDLTNDTYPLYVDENGDFTLELKTLVGSEDTDAFDDTSLPTSSVILLDSDSNGYEETTIKTYSITTSRNAILEIKYSMSYAVYLDNTYTTISDNLARRIQTHINVTGDTRDYGPVGKCYSSGSVDSVTGPFYNSASTYITLLAGTYDVTFIGGVASNVKSGGGGTTAKATYVEFAIDNDFVFMRLH